MSLFFLPATLSDESVYELNSGFFSSALGFQERMKVVDASMGFCGSTTIFSALVGSPSGKR